MVMRPALQFSNSRAWVAGSARAALGGVLVAAVAILALGAATVLALAALTAAAFIAALGALLYAFARLRRRAAPASAPRTLEARRTGAGWTVDALGRFG